MKKRLLDVVELTRRLVDIPSITGAEEKVGDFLFQLLSADGWKCRRQEVAPHRFNLLALRGSPRVLLTSHMDTVPPFITSREDEDYIYGRGACDAKGQIAALVAAGSDLVRDGGQDIGLLFVVGEETDSAGAWAAHDLGLQADYLINGEPTDNHLVSGHKGIVSVRLTAAGRTAHSGYPEEGDSAVDKLLDVLQDLRRLPLPHNKLFGESHLNIGVIRAGRAANVIADQAEAEILIRTVAQSETYLEALNSTIGGRVAVEVLAGSEPQEMAVVEGFPVKTVGYGTDVPALRALGTPVLFGPGSILDAHTANEKISKRELRQGVNDLKKLVGALRRSNRSQSEGGACLEQAKRT